MICWLCMTKPQSISNVLSSNCLYKILSQVYFAFFEVLSVLSPQLNYAVPIMFPLSQSNPWIYYNNTDRMWHIKYTEWLPLVGEEFLSFCKRCMASSILLLISFSDLHFFIFLLDIVLCTSFCQPQSTTQQNDGVNSNLKNIDCKK